MLVVTVSAPAIPAADRNVFYHRLVRAAAGVPGVAHAGGSINPPIIGSLVGDLLVTVPGAQPQPNAETISQSDFITPGWLATYSTAIHAGRDIDDRDTVATPPVMLVNEAFTRRFFPDRNVVGTTFALAARLPTEWRFSAGLEDRCRRRRRLRVPLDS